MKRILLLLAVLLGFTPAVLSQDKPRPVTSNEPGNLDLIVDEIYARVRARFEAYQDSLDDVRDSLYSLTDGWLRFDTAQPLTTSGLLLLVDTTGGDDVTIKSNTGLRIRGSLTGGSGTFAEAKLFLYEDPDNGVSNVSFSAPPNVKATYEMELPDSNRPGNGYLLGSASSSALGWSAPVWSKTGDTLIQHFEVWVGNYSGGSLDSALVTLGTAYSSSTSYNIALAFSLKDVADSAVTISLPPIASSKSSQSFYVVLGGSDGAWVTGVCSGR